MDIIKKLPKDIRNYILTFTYEPQPFILLNDIRHYIRTRQEIKDWYTNHFAWEYPNAESDWLYNDLLGFCNENSALMFGYKAFYFEVFSRAFLLKNKSRDELLMHRHIFRYSDKTNNVIWGLLTIQERNEFILNWEI
uniref:Uncharacterized protein n=1 Tax=viral metagenome TaxID=1070528 RepID=A0A6C0HQT6_9ZZZZ